MKNNKQKDNQQNIFETIKQVNKKENAELEEKQQKALKKEEKQREEYVKNLSEEKIELLKLKQGVITNSDKLHFQPDEKKSYTLWQKFKNFIYHNKWWLGIASFFVLIAAFLIYDKLTATKADINIMLLCDNEDLYKCYNDIGSYFDSIVYDYNNDGENYSDIIYIPISDDEDANATGLYESNLTQISAQFQTGETMLIIADSKSDYLVIPDENLVDLTQLYPDNPDVKNYGYYLKNTDFAQCIGFTGTLPDDLYIGIRKVTKTLTSEKNMTENYNNAMEILDKIINNSSK